MHIAIGTDHHGFLLKDAIIEYLVESPDGQSIDWIDLGCYSDAPCDYPEQAKLVVDMMRSGQAELGVLMCGTGVGMSMAANRFSGIYAGLAWNEEIARLNREHDKVNILVLPADFLTAQQAISIINAWLGATYLDEHHQKRIEQIDAFGGA